MTNDMLDSILSEYDAADIDIEIWKDIPVPPSKYNYQYQISNYGRFRNKTTGNVIKPYYRIEKQHDGTKVIGYYRAVIKLDEHKTWKPTIHRLVALMFVSNSDPDNLTDVDHVDGNHLNNHYSNLEWVTKDENLRRAFELKLKRPRYGSENVVSKWVEDEVEFICRLMEKGFGYHEIYNKFKESYPDTIKTEQQLKNLFYNLVHPTNPKWTNISKKYDIHQSLKK